MALKTKIRTTHVSGSVPGSGESAAVSTALGLTDLDGILDHMASAIKRTHGATTWSANTAGQFEQDIVVAGTTPKITIGDAGAEDTMLVFDGNAVDYRIGLDDGTDKLEVGVGSAHGSTTAITIDSSQITTFPNTTAASAVGTAAVVITGGASVGADLIVGDDLSLLTDSAVLNMGAGNDVTLTHDGTTGLTIAAAPISIDSTGALDLSSTTGDIKLQDGGVDQIIFDLDGTGATVIMKAGANGDRIAVQQFDGTEVLGIEDDASLKIAGGLGSGGVTVTAAGALAADGVIKTDDTTEATSTTDGSLQTDGGLSVVMSAVIGDDLDLLSDGAIMNFGAGKDITFTHDGGTGMDVVAAGAFGISAGAASTWKTTAGALIVSAEADAASSLIVTGSGVKIDGSSARGITIGSTAGCAVSLGNAVSEVTVNDNLTVTGDLTVNGATVTIDTTNLTVQDPIITLNEGGQALNANAGLLFTSGSSAATKPGVAFGRVANDTWGIGQIAVPISGTMTTVAGMTTSASALRAGKFELDSSADYMELDTNVKIVAAADIVLDPAGNNVLPGGDSADSLGASGTAWAAIYVDNIDLNGQGTISIGGTGRIDLDADDNTSIRASADDVITFEAGGNDEMSMSVTALYPATDDGLALGSANQNWSDLFLADGSVLSFGDDQDITFTHNGTTTVTVAGGTLATAALTSTTIVASGIVKTDDTTAATSTTDGSLQTDGGLSVALDAVVGDDLIMLSDSAVVHFGAGKDVTLTHTNDVGLHLNAGMRLGFRDQGGEYIYSVEDGILGLVGASEIDLTATAIDINGTANISGLTTLQIGLVPDANDGAYLGTTALGWSDLFLAEGGVINWDNGDATLTQASNVVTLAGATLTATLTNALSITANGGIGMTSYNASAAVADIALDLDGMTDIGAALADADLIAVDDGAGGTNRKSAMSRVSTYILSKRSKAVLSGSAVNTDTDVDTGLGSTLTDAGVAAKEVYVNGQLMVFANDAASNGDWYPGGSAGNIKFEFALQADDIIQCIVWG